MLIKFQEIVKKHNLNINGILHVGAHHAEELPDYLACGINKIIWVEAEHKTFEVLKMILKPHTEQKAYSFAASDEDGIEVDFHIASNGESSSILEMDTHLKEHPHITIVDKKKVFTKKIDTFFQEENLESKNYNFLNLDIQGAELLALKGMKDSLKNIDYIYSEVNIKELYKGCAKLSEIDEFLAPFGFSRVELEMTQHGWGDAFYIKKK